MTKYVIKSNLQVSKVKKVKHKHTVMWITLMICALSLCAITLLCNLNVVQNIFNGNKYNISLGSYYVVCIEPYSEQTTDIRSEAENIKLRGGAGNIVDYNNKKYIVLNCYFDLGKTESVIKNLAEQDITAKYFLLNTKSENIKKYSATEQNLIRQNNQFIINTIKDIYDFISQFDAYNISENKLEIYITKTSLNCYNELNKLQSITNYNTDKFYLRMLNLYSIIQVLCNNDFANSTFSAISSEFKNNLFNIIYSFCV